MISIALIQAQWRSSSWCSDFSLSLPQGQWLSLIGPNGAGKSTLLQMISGLRPLESGSLLLNGQKAHHMAPKDRPLAYQFQNGNMFPFLSVEKNLLFAMNRLPIKQEQKLTKIRETLDSLQIPEDFLPRFPTQISGGELARINLCSILLQDRPIWLLDEPFAAVQANARMELLSLLKARYRKEGRTVICVTHHISDALFCSDQIALISQGRNLGMIAPDQMRSHPTSEFMARFLGLGSVISFGGGVGFVLPEDIHTREPPGFVHGVDLCEYWGDKSFYLHQGLKQVAHPMREEIWQLLPHLPWTGSVFVLKSRVLPLSN